MAVLFITEFSDVGRLGMYGSTADIDAAAMPPKAVQQVAIGSSSVSSATFAQGTQLVRLHTDVACAWTFGTAPNASAATSSRMAANTTEYFTVPLNGAYKVAVITIS